MRASADRYLIEMRTPGGGLVRQFVWDPRRPAPIGYPLRFVVEKAAGGLRLRDLSGEGAYSGAREIPASLADSGHLVPLERVGGYAVSLRRLRRDLKEARSLPLPAPMPVQLDDSAEWFQRLLVRGGGLLAALVLIALVIPGPKVEKTPDSELIPPQFAKILMTPHEKKVEQGGGGDPRAGGGSPGEGQAKAAPTKAADTAVARAFRASALQNSVKGLLKGGMTTFLSQSGNLLLGADSSGQVRQMLKAPQGGFPSSPDAGFAKGPNVNVAALGGGGLGGNGKGAGVGYGTGEKVGIGGQGGGFVSLDIPGSTVEDGLSKDEVGKVIHSHLSEVRYCYESSMLRSPDVEGKLVLDFTIGSNGKVQTASVRESSLQDPRLDDCILRRLTKWAFPQPKGGVTVAVSYPFIFKALQR
jgi:TonB family protein